MVERGEVGTDRTPVVAPARCSFRSAAFKHWRCKSRSALVAAWALLTTKYTPGCPVSTQ
jgi:hypothetical protein